MARKSKAAFKMKGHSISGIKGFKDTSLGDGRAASSAFQMKESPLHAETEAEKLGWTKAEIGEADPFAHHVRSKKPGETGVEYGMRGWMEAAQRLRGKRGEEEEEKKDVITEQIQEWEDPVKDSKMYKDLAETEEFDIHDIEIGEEFPEPEGEFVEETTTSYEVQSGDNLSRIAKANNMTLEELLEKNPEYKDNPNFVRRGATIKL